MTTKTWGQRELAALLLLTSVELVVFLDVSIVNVALPAMGTALALGEAGLAWVINAYQLTFGGLQLVAGRAADLIGRRRVFQAGLTLFTAASLLAGAAPNAATLVAARAVQGVGAALVVPAELALLAAIFTGSAAYRRAFGVWSAMGAAGAASGVALGGILTQALGWESIFLVNVPVGAAALALSRRCLPADPRTAGGTLRAGWRADAAGAVSSTGALLGLVYLAAELASRGWDAVTLGSAAVTVLLAAVFAVSRRRSPAPILPRALLRLRDVRGGAVANALVGATHVPAFVLLSLLLQQVLGYSAIAAGFAVLPIAVVNMITARTLLPWALGRHGPRLTLAVGMGLLATAMAAFALLLHPGAGFLTAVLPPSIVFAIGLPAVFAGSTAPASAPHPKKRPGPRPAWSTPLSGSAPPSASLACSSPRNAGPPSTAAPATPPRSPTACAWDSPQPRPWPPWASSARWSCSPALTPHQPASPPAGPKPSTSRTREPARCDRKTQGTPVPALPSWLAEPLWAQFKAAAAMLRAAGDGDRRLLRPGRRDHHDP